jgi:purine-binding chemotaxis protein CheW
MKTAELPAAAMAAPASPAGRPGIAAATDEFYLAFRLAGETYAIDILRIREIVEFTAPTAIPMMPASVRGVINLRGSVVPVIDLAIRFGRAATGVGRRTCIVIVEVRHEGALLVLGLMVDGVNAVMEIPAASIEPPPAFGTRVDADFIEGMAKIDKRFVTILNLARVLSIAEIAAIKSADEAPLSEAPAADFAKF